MHIVSRRTRKLIMEKTRLMRNWKLVMTKLVKRVRMDTQARNECSEQKQKIRPVYAMENKGQWYMT